MPEDESEGGGAGLSGGLFSIVQFALQAVQGQVQLGRGGDKKIAAKAEIKVFIYHLSNIYLSN